MPLAPELAEFLPDFQNEVRTHLRRLENGLLMFENQSYERTILDDLFRAAHTIKGSARMMGYDNISTLAHAIEDVLVLYQADRLVPNTANIDIVLTGLDHIRQMVEYEPDAPSDISEPLEQLQGLTSRTIQDPNASTTAPTAKLVMSFEPLSIDEQSQSPLTAISDDWVRVSATRLDELLRLTGELVLISQQLDQLQYDFNGHVVHLREYGRQFDTQPTVAGQVKPLLNAADDLRRQLNRVGRELSSTREALEDEVIELRLVPIAELFATLPRAVRDLARNTGKDINLTITGEDTRIDRRMLQALNEPLVHILRNAVDHGVEPPDERETVNKPATGTIAIAVKRRGARVQIQISDDGRGISLEALRRSAVQKGLISADQAATLDEANTLNLIYASGLSTAAYVTETSGRGVGMGAVKAAIARLGGNLNLATTEFKGTTFTLEFPITLALARVLIVQAAEQTYALPDAAIESVMRLGNGRLRRTPTGAFLNYLDSVLPLHSLSDVLTRVQTQYENQTAIVLHTADQPVAITVDRVLDERQVVIKSLGRLLNRNDTALGATFLADGTVVTILDPNTLQQMAQASRSAHNAHYATIDGATLPRLFQRRILVVEDSATTREMERSILYNAGYNVEVAANGRVAFELLQESSFDLVLSDVEMPEMDGYTLCKKLQNTPGLTRLPVILLTSNDSPDLVRRGLEAGAQAYLVKQNFNQQVLLETIERLLY